MTNSSKTRGQSARKTVIGRRSVALSTSPTSGTTCRTSIRQVNDHQIPVETATVDSNFGDGDGALGEVINSQVLEVLVEHNP